MVRALLAGTKTQTRRVVKPQPAHPQFGKRHMLASDDEGIELFLHSATLHTAIRSPYGKPGDRLWVRESWMPDPPIDDTWASTEWAGCRDGKIAGVPERFQHPAFCNYAASWLHGDVRWTPSIHMPRWASRILLDVAGLRVERLQDISEADAIAEGIETNAAWPGGFYRNYALPEEGDVRALPPRDSYRSLWETINGAGSWDANPWVWVVEFRRATP